MTWLELIDELKKQPHYLLEQEATVWGNVIDNGTQVNCFSKPVIELTSPYNDGADIHEWLSTPDFHLSLVIDLPVVLNRRVTGLCGISTDALLDEILRRKEKDISGADVLLDLLVDREILAFADKDDYGLYRKL